MQPLVEAAGNPRVATDKLNNLYFLILALQPGLGIVLPSGPLKEWPTQQNEGHREGLKRKRLTAPGNRQPVVGKVVAEIPHESGRRVITKVALDLRGVPTGECRVMAKVPRYEGALLVDSSTEGHEPLPFS